MQIWQLTMFLSFTKLHFYTSIPLQISLCFVYKWAGIVKTVHRLATSWTVWGSNHGGGEIFHSHLDWPWGPPSLLYNGYRVIPGDKVARVVLTTHPHLTLRLKKEYRYTSTPHLCLYGWNLPFCTQVSYIFVLPVSF